MIKPNHATNQSVSFFATPRMSMNVSKRRSRTLPESAPSATKTPTTVNAHAMAKNPTSAMMAIVHSNDATASSSHSESSRESVSTSPVSVSHDASGGADAEGGREHSAMSCSNDFLLCIENIQLRRARVCVPTRTETSRYDARGAVQLWTEGHIRRIFDA